MRLHILCEFFLRQQIKFNHCICQRLRVGSQIGYKPKHGPSKSTINLFQRYFTRIININDLKMKKKQLFNVKAISFIKVGLNILPAHGAKIDVLKAFDQDLQAGYTPPRIVCDPMSPKLDLKQKMNNNLWRSIFSVLQNKVLFMYFYFQYMRQT